MLFRSSLWQLGSYGGRRTSPDPARSRTRGTRSYYPEASEQDYQEGERGRSGWTSARQEPTSELRNRGHHSSEHDAWKGKNRNMSMIREDDKQPSSQSRTPTPRQEDTQPQQQPQQQEVVPRSRWQTVLLEAGGIGAAVSEESMRRLKYCLQWLQVITFCATSSFFGGPMD